MKKRHINWIIAASALAMISLVIIQMRWMRQSRELLEEQFTNKVNMALCSTVERMAGNETQCDEIKACCQAPANACCSISPAPPTQEMAIQAALDQSLQFYDINLPYTVQIIPKDSSEKEGMPNYACSLSPVLESDTHYLKLDFIGKEAYVSRHMDPMVLASILILLLICAIFSFATWQLFRQKRMADKNRDFFNHMTHEFRTPLTNIQLAGNLLYKKNKDLIGNPYLEIIRKESQQLSSQVENLLRLSSLEKPTYDLKRNPVDLGEITRNVLENMDLQIRERAADVNFHQNGSNFPILGDAFHLGNAFRNIIDNSIKYSGTEPHVYIDLNAEQKGTTIVFRDNGNGLTEKDRQNIFEKFHRSESAKASGEKGFGLGLAYVKKIVELHNGNISVASESGQGTRFEIFFPSQN